MAHPESAPPRDGADESARANGPADDRRTRDTDARAPDSRELGSHDRGSRSGGTRSLCPECAHVKLVHSERGSTFLLCRLAATDARFPKYPPQPVLACPGFER